MDLTIIVNYLDNKYSQTHINNFYTQCKNSIVDPFDFVVFTTPDELEHIKETKKIDGFIQGIHFHIPKYGREWLEIDLIKHTKPNGISLFVTPNIILNNPSKIVNYKTTGLDKVKLADENLAYFVYRNNVVENIIKKWDNEEDDITFMNGEFSQAFQVNELENFPFLKDYTKEYPTELEAPIITIPYWYVHKDETYIKNCYNRAVDLYSYLPNQIEMEITGYSLEEIKKIFNQELLQRARITKIQLSNDVEDPASNEELHDICHYLIEEGGISVDITTDLLTEDAHFWGVLGILFRTMGNFTVIMNEHTGPKYEKQLQNAKALLKSGARVFWQYTRTTQTNEDIQSAKQLSIKHNFTGFNFIEAKVEEVDIIETKTIEKEPVPDYKLIELETIKAVEKDAEYREIKVKFDRKVLCKAKIDNECYIDKTGNVFPCVYTAKNILEAKINPYEDTDILYDWEDNNCKINKLEDILTNKFFKGYFNNKLKLDPASVCNKKCGGCNES